MDKKKDEKKDVEKRVENHAERNLLEKENHVERKDKLIWRYICNKIIMTTTTCFVFYHFYIFLFKIFIIILIFNFFKINFIIYLQ